ncbi:MAG: hypothetical protein GX580_11940 [Candidatus Hydrogenedens sp.]|nr:hypothetical protein [Candidatus Hydrogenedentota bacterium]NLF58337.1 hypothetical protein [Candidatus Hydrogenedens sp.]
MLITWLSDNAGNMAILLLAVVNLTHLIWRKNEYQKYDMQIVWVANGFILLFSAWMLIGNLFELFTK